MVRTNGGDDDLDMPVAPGFVGATVGVGIAVGVVARRLRLGSSMSGSAQQRMASTPTSRSTTMTIP